MGAPTRTWFSAVLVLGVVLVTLGSGLVAPAGAADTNRPRIVKVTMEDADGDDRADRIVLVYNERIRHPGDADGRYPFGISGPAYGIRRVNATRSTKTLVILIQEKATSDIAARPAISYAPTLREPVKDLAGNQARRQTFRATTPLPCAENATSDVYADPVVSRTNVPPPTGVAFPAWCAYPTITAALGALNGGPGRVIAMGAEAGTAVFRKETFPFLLPEGVTLTTADDPDVGGSGLDARRYVVRFGGSAPNAVQLQGGTLRGLTLTNARSVDASEMVLCTPGSSEIEAVTLSGLGTGGGRVFRGLGLQSGCNLADDGLGSFMFEGPAVRVRNMNGPGIEVEDGADLALADARVYNNEGDGLWIKGTATLTGGQVGFNEDGLLIDGSESAVIDDLIIRDNVESGLEVHSSNVSMHLNHVFNNSRSHGWDEAQLLFVGAPTGGVKLWSGASCILSYPVGYGHIDTCTDAGPTDPPDDACLSTNENRIYGYDISPISPSQSVGVYAAQGAIVQAGFNTWAQGGALEGTGTDSDSSFIEAENSCGTLMDPGDTSGIPIQ